MNTENNLARNAAITDIDALLAASLDDLDDLPSFEVPNPGVYVLEVSLEQKDVNGKAAIEASYAVKEVIELVNKEDAAPAAGTKFSTLFTLNEYGIGKLKDFCKPFAAHFDCKQVGELVRDHIKNVTITANVGRRVDKEDPEKVYAKVKVLSIV